MKTTLELPDDLMKAIKLRAVHEGKKLKDAIAETLRAGLAARARATAADKGQILFKKDPKTGLAVIQGSPDAPALRMNASQMRELEEQALLKGDLERAGISI
jgi:plasmid stability protein